MEDNNNSNNLKIKYSIETINLSYLGLYFSFINLIFIAFMFYFLTEFIWIIPIFIIFSIFILKKGKHNVKEMKDKYYEFTKEGIKLPYKSKKNVDFISVNNIKALIMYIGPYDKPFDSLLITNEGNEFILPKEVTVKLRPKIKDFPYHNIYEVNKRDVNLYLKEKKVFLYQLIEQVPDTKSSRKYFRIIFFFLILFFLAFIIYEQRILAYVIGGIPLIMMIIAFLALRNIDYLDIVQNLENKKINI